MRSWVGQTSTTGHPPWVSAPQSAPVNDLEQKAGEPKWASMTPSRAASVSGSELDRQHYK
jgi:hypothetical protein